MRARARSTVPLRKYLRIVLRARPVPSHASLYLPDQLGAAQYDMKRRY